MDVSAIKPNIFVEAMSNIFASNIEKLNNNSLKPDRKYFIELFKNKGIPDTKNEEYKYTNLITVLNNNYNYNLNPQKRNLKINDIFKCDVPELNADILILLNGHYYSEKEIIKEKANGIIIGSLSAAANKYPNIINKYLNQNQNNTDSLVALNKAFSTDGIFIYIPENITLTQPIQIINIAMADEDLMIQHRNMIIIDKNSKAEIIICDHTLSPKKFLTNQVLEIFAAENSQLSVTRLQNEHLGAVQISHSFISQGKSSKVTFNNITLHGGLVRNNIFVSLDGENSENYTNGLYFLDKGQHVDNYVFVEHKKPYCTSNQLFKGILDDYSTGAFTGKILVYRDAQKTLAYQSNKNILLSDDTKIDSRPQLEIYADDVKCSHGSAVGQMDENAMFYLQSRGISQKEARFMLLSGFSNEVIKQIEAEPLRLRVNDLIEKRLRGELSRCNNCEINCND
jgi:Fe-S cluster assembly protein SufD